MLEKIAGVDVINNKESVVGVVLKDTAARKEQKEMDATEQLVEVGIDAS